jgi:hydroxyacylglutathione hydrolase
MSHKILNLPLGPLQTNCYVLGCMTTSKAAVIDPSWAGHLIFDRLTAEGWTLDKILLTHAHFDHVGGLAELKRLADAPIYIHPEAVPMLAMAEAAGQLWGIGIEPCPPADQLLEDDQIIPLGELDLTVLYTPGHAPGHVCFHLSEHEILFDGDVLFEGSIGRTDLPGGDYDLLLASIHNRLLPLPDNTQVLSGHGPATTIGNERRWNPFLVANR